MCGGGIWIAVLALSVAIAAAAEGGAAAAAYEALRVNGLPIGLLPKGVIEFSIGEDGRFEAVIDRPCTAAARFDSGVRYEANVSGELSYGQIASLSGVSAQDLFLWFPVRNIFVLPDRRRSGVIFFDVGVVQKQFPISLFEIPLDCEPDLTSPDGSRVTEIAATAI